ncbi:MAG: DUF58 domain-containing protein [Halobacteriota archaeon]
MTRSIDSTSRSNGHAADAEVFERFDREKAKSSAENGSSESDRSEAKAPESHSKRGMTVASTERWYGIVAVALLAVAIGVLAKRPSLLLVGAVVVGFATYPRVTSPPDPTVSIDRRIDPEKTKAGETATVRTTITNEGDRSLFDLRIVDGAPPMLGVVDGSPRRATTLEPDGSVTIEYDLRVRPGRHWFRPTTLLCRDASGAIEVETEVAELTTIECGSGISTVPLRSRSRHRTGTLITDEGGSGLEFHSVKSYERGDAASRIDWRRFARTGELTSIAFRTERLADVVLCVDARPAAYRASDRSDPHAVAHAVAAAGRIGDALLGMNHRIGLAVFGREVSLLSLASGSDHAERLHRRLGTDPALSLTPPPSARSETTVDSAVPESIDLDRQLSKIRAQFGSNVQFIVLSPLCDDEAARIVQRFESGGAVVTVVSPDVTTDRTAGGRLARIDRGNRVNALRNANIPVVDWTPSTPLETALSSLEWRHR